MDYGIYAGDTDKTIYVRLRDSTTGLAKTGLVFNSTGAVCSYTLPLAARADIPLATQTVTGAHADGGFVEVDATNCKGLYRLDLSDAAIASGAYTVISIEFDGVIEESVQIPLHTRKVDTVAINGVTAAAVRLALSAGQMIPFTVDNTAHTPTGTVFQADDITEATADHYNGRLIIWTSGALVEQETDITDYVLVGGRGQFTVTALTEAPANNDTGLII